MKRSQSARQGWETRRAREAAAKAPAGEAKIAADVKKKGLHISQSALARARAVHDVKRPNPFTLPQFPPAAMPPEKSGQRMAMDEGFGWANGGWHAAAIQGIFAEGLAFPGYPFLAELSQRPEYRRFAEILATEMTRKWIRLQSVGDDDKSDKIKELTDAIDRFKLRDAFRRCIEIDELFGRSHLYIDTDATDDREELKTSIGNGRNETSRAKVGKDALVAFRPVEPVWVYPISYDAQDPLKPDWYDPTTWFVLGKEVHKTRLLRFVGREVPDLLKPAYSFGGLSMTQMSKPYVDNWLRTRQSVADLINAFSVFVLKTDLETALASDGDQLFARADMFNFFRNNRGLMILNKESEEFQNVAASIGGLEGLQAQTQEHLAAVSGIPIVKLLGIQPTGLNASDEGGIRMFYDWIAASQEKRLRHQLTAAIDFIQLSIWGEVDQEITFAFEPLWALDEKAKAEVRQIEAQTGIALCDGGVISQEEERKRIASDPESAYATIDVEDMPDLKEEEMEGLDPKAGGGQRGIGRAPHAPGEGEEHGEEGHEGDEEETEDEYPDEVEPSPHDLGSHWPLEKDGFPARAQRRGQQIAYQGSRRVAERERRLALAEEEFRARAAERDRRMADAESAFNERVRAREERMGEGFARRVRDSDFADRAEARETDRHYRYRQHLDESGESWLANIAQQVAALRAAGGNDEAREAAEAALESNPSLTSADKDLVRRIAERRGISGLAGDAGWNEKEHPRGQPGNAGQFASGAGGGSKATSASKKNDSDGRGSKKTRELGPGGENGTLKERTELRKHIKAEIEPVRKQELIDRLANSYEVALNRASKVGNTKKVEELQKRIKKLGKSMDYMDSMQQRRREQRERRAEWTKLAARQPKVKNALAKISVDKDFGALQGDADYVAATFAEVAVDLKLHDDMLDKMRVRSDDLEFEVGSKKFFYGGWHRRDWDDNTTEIALFPKHCPVHNARRMAAHEIMHAKVRYVIKKYREDLKNIKPDEMRADGSLRDDAKGKYPFYEKMHEAYFGVDPSVFATTDGVTPYSIDHWVAARDGHQAYALAIEETLCEMSADQASSIENRDRLDVTLPYGHRLLHYRGLKPGTDPNVIVPEYNPPPAKAKVKKSETAWKRLYRTVEELYDK